MEKYPFVDACIPRGSDLEEMMEGKKKNTELKHEKTNMTEDGMSRKAAETYGPSSECISNWGSE